MSLHGLRSELRRVTADMEEVPRVVVIGLDGSRREIAATCNAFFRMMALKYGEVKAEESHLLTRCAADLVALRDSAALEPGTNNRGGEGIQMFSLVAALEKGPAE